MPATLFYLVVDVSGSAVRGGFLDGVARALPAVVEDVERRCGGAARVGVMTYATGAAPLIRMTCVAELDLLPVPIAGGFSSLVAGFELLGRTVRDDRALLTADGVAAGRPTALVVADGLPTDRDEDVLAARDGLDVDLHVALPAGVPALAVAGLRATPHRLDLGTPELVAASLTEAVRRALA